jgi:hypothetical protein
MLLFASHLAFASPVLVRGTVTASATQSASPGISLSGSLGGLVMGPAEQAPFALIQGFWAPRSATGPSDVALTPAAFTFRLNQNAPNPFNPRTMISFVVPNGAADRVTLEIYDLGGRLVKSLVDQHLPPGPQNADWDGRDNDHRPLASGVYYARLRCGRETATKQLVLLK